MEKSQTLPIGLQECWDFFSNPHNLSVITPPELSFEVFTEEQGRFEPGMLLFHRVRPFSFLRVRWVTEITHVVPGRLFVDEQRFGPYRFWHHQHLFEEVLGGTKVRDVVHYALPFGVAGRLLNRLAVRGRLEEIFDYRCEKLEAMFGKA